MTLKPIATKADSKVELTAGVTSYLNDVMLGKIEPTVVQNEPVVSSTLLSAFVAIGFKVIIPIVEIDNINIRFLFLMRFALLYETYCNQYQPKYCYDCSNDNTRCLNSVCYRQSKKKCKC